MVKSIKREDGLLETKEVNWWSLVWRTLFIWQLSLTIIVVSPLKYYSYLMGPTLKSSFYFGLYSLVFLAIAIMAFGKSYKPLLSRRLVINRRLWQKHNFAIAGICIFVSILNAGSALMLSINYWSMFSLFILPIFLVLVLVESFLLVRHK